MAIVSLSEAAKLTGKSKSTLNTALNNGKLKATKNNENVWEINTDDLFALYSEKEQQKCEKLETELADCKAQLLSLESKLKDEVSKREELELLLEKVNTEIIEDVKTYINLPNYDSIDTDTFSHINDFIRAIEPFMLNPNKAALFGYGSTNAVYFRILANYNSKLEKFNRKKKEYESDVRFGRRTQHEDLDRRYEKFTYRISDRNVYQYITKGYVKQDHNNWDHNSKMSFLLANFIFES